MRWTRRSSLATAGVAAAVLALTLLVLVERTDAELGPRAPAGTLESTASAFPASPAPATPGGDADVAVGGALRPGEPALAGNPHLADATNTGPRTTALRPASGDIVASGAVIEKRVYTQPVRITAQNVTVRDSRFLGGVLIAEASQVVIEWSEIGEGLSISSSTGVVVRNTDIEAGSDAVHVTADRGRMNTDVLLDTVWAHEVGTPPADAHVDGIQLRGVNGFTARNCTFDLGSFKPQDNAAFFPEDANGGNSNVRILDTWMNGGGYTFRYAAGQVGGDWEVSGLRVGSSYRFSPTYDPSQGGPPSVQHDNWYQRKDGSWAPLVLR